jgi:two-component system, cell cycle response regulator DivK
MISQDMSDWTVLIVDDEPDNVGVAQKLLNYNGADVHVARNGLEGLAMLERVEPTFILLDLSMPEMGGWEMFEKVRGMTTLNNTPIIALTAHAMAGDKEKVISAGFDGYIAKPFRINSFLEDIKKCLQEFQDQQ